jgi:hypothetical protein
MNQQAIEQALGKLVVDGYFRAAFFIDPAVASEAAGIPLTDRERNAPRAYPPGRTRRLPALSRRQARRRLWQDASAGCRRLARRSVNLENGGRQ